MYIGMYGCSAQASGRFCARAVVDLNRGLDKDVCGFTTSCCAGDAARCVKSRKGKGKGRDTLVWFAHFAFMCIQAGHFHGQGHCRGGTGLPGQPRGHGWDVRDVNDQ